MYNIFLEIFDVLIANIKQLLFELMNKCSNFNGKKSTAKNNNT